MVFGLKPPRLTPKTPSTDPPADGPIVLPPKPAPLAPPAQIARPSAPPVVFDPDKERTPTSNQVFNVENRGQFDEKVQFWHEKDYDVGGRLEAQLLDSDKAHPYTVLDKSPVEGTNLWSYTAEQADVYRPWTFSDDFETVQTEMDAWIPWFEQLGDPLPPGTLGERVTSPPATLTGTPEDMLDAHLGLKFVYENMRSMAKFVEDFYPDQFEGLIEAQSKTSDPTKYSTLNPIEATVAALNNIAEGRPDTYTQYLASDEGRVALWTLANRYLMEKAPENVSILKPGKFLGAIEEEFLPDVPILKDALVRATEIAGDPAFIALTAFAGPAGVANKAKMLLSISALFGTGEEVAEEIGAPPIIGGVSAALLAAKSGGFTRSLMNSGLRRARHFPVVGEPATELLIRANEVPRDLRHLRQMTGESLGPPGSVTRELELSAAEVKQGRHTLQSTDKAGTELGRLEWRTGAVAEEETLHVNNVVTQVERQGVGTGLMTDLTEEAALRGIERVTGDLNSAGGINLFARFGAKFKDLTGKVLSQEKALVALTEGKGVTGEIAVPRLPGRILCR